MPSFLWRHQPGDLVIGRRGRTRFAPLYRVAHAARAAHMHVIGRSGKGKSKALEHFIFQDIANGLGCGLIDPHSQLIDDLLRHLLTRQVLMRPDVLRRILYVDPARKDYIIPFNVLATPDEPYKVAAAVLEAFRRTWSESLREAPHFSNVMTHALLLLIQTGYTLVDLPRLLVDKAFREALLELVDDPDLTAFFHDRYDQWGREAPVMRESSLNKVTTLTINPHLKLMLGQKENRLDFQSIMDEGRILLLDLGHCDTETNRLIGSLVVTGLELAMRRRRTRTLWNLTIDEFAAYVANEGSTQTLAHVFSEGRKFRMSMTVAHQTLSQLTPRMLGALGNTDTKVIFGIDRYDAEYFAKVIGRVDTEAVKREPKTNIQHEVFSSLPEQWEQWVDRLRFQPPRQATVMSQDREAATIITLPIPRYTATDEQVEHIRRDSLSQAGIPYTEAKCNLGQETQQRTATYMNVPEYEFVPNS